METIDIVLVSLIIIVVVVLVALLIYYMRALDRKFLDDDTETTESLESAANVKSNEQNVESKSFYIDPYSFEEVPYRVKATTGLKDSAYDREFESLRITEWDGNKEDKTSSNISWSGSRDMRAPQSPPLNTLKESFGDFTPSSFRSTEDNDNKTDTQQQNEDIDRKGVETNNKQMDANNSDKSQEVNETKPKESSNDITDTKNQ